MIVINTGEVFLFTTKCLITVFVVSVAIAVAAALTHEVTDSTAAAEVCDRSVRCAILAFAGMIILIIAIGLWAMWTKWTV